MMICRSAERGHVAEICLNSQRPQVLEHRRIGQIAESFFPQECRPETGMTRFLDARVAGRQSDLHPYRGQKLVLPRVVERPLREHRHALEAIHARSVVGRLMLPATATSDTESWHVVIIYPQYFLDRRCNGIAIAITTLDPRGNQDVQFVGGRGILGNKWLQEYVVADDSMCVGRASTHRKRNHQYEKKNPPHTRNHRGRMRPHHALPGHRGPELSFTGKSVECFARKSVWAVADREYPLDCLCAGEQIQQMFQVKQSWQRFQAAEAERSESGLKNFPSTGADGIRPATSMARYDRQSRSLRSSANSPSS